MNKEMPVSKKITAEHLNRGAVIYVRQSTLGQVADHTESKRRQYALAETARTMGFGSVGVIHNLQALGQDTPDVRRYLNMLDELMPPVVRAFIEKLALESSTQHAGVRQRRFVSIVSAEAGIAARQ